MRERPDHSDTRGVAGHNELRPATLADLDDLILADRQADQATGAQPPEPPDHRETIRGFIVDADKGAALLERATDHRVVAAILFRFRRRPERAGETPDAWLFRELSDDLFDPGRCFCTVFTLWVDPAERRRGHATRLKRHMEEVARARGATLIYTHTAAANAAALALNRKLGYQVVRTGPIWDAVVRVSLVKRL
jgi:ribosomal protein S18 acetylase RimI-like enzyme